MNKIGMTVALLACIAGGTLFSQQGMEESWVSLGAEFGNYFDYAPEKTGYTGAAGGNLKGYGFFDRGNVGLFFHYGFLYPVLDPERPDVALLWDSIIGPGFRVHFSDTVKLYFGAGIGWILGASESQKGAKTYTNGIIRIGVGGDLGIKVDLTETVYLNVGLTASCFFFNYEFRSVSEKIDDQTVTETQLPGGRTANSLFFGVKPYIGIGFNAYSEKPQRGKPPK